jgi:hypothetical protein
MSIHHVDVHICRNAGIPDCPASGQSGTGLKKTKDAYRTKLILSGIFLVRYRTKIRDAGLPMPALVSSMPMPSYAKEYIVEKQVLNLRALDLIPLN